MSSREIHINIWQSLLLALFVLPLLLPKGVVSRGYTLVAFLPLLFGFAAQPDKSSVLKMTIYDVGQGLAVLVKTPNHQLLYDTGPAFRSGSSAAERVLIPDFKTTRLKNLSALVISHTDNDHAGGQDILRKEFNPTIVYSPKNDPVKDSTPCKAGNGWVWDDVQFEFLYPFESTIGANKNNNSCVLRITYSGRSVLLTGDIEKQAEYAMLTQYKNLESDIVFAPHHGSNSSSTSEFIRAVSAKYVIFATGFANRWRFPKSEVLSRWQISPVQIYNIATAGQLDLTLSQQGEIQTLAWISQKCRYWHQDCD